MRQRLFKPQTFFLALIHLVLGSGQTSYALALRKAWLALGLKGEPVKSSLSKYRLKISFKFFKSRFEEMIVSSSSLRRTFHGLFIYAVDGQESAIPISEEILRSGCRGRARKNQMETYYPRLYISQSFDVLNEVITGSTAHPTRHENRDALELLKRAEMNSVTLYDRAYLSRALLESHFMHGSFFVFRCARGATFKEVMVFAKSRKKEDIWMYGGKSIRLVKVKNKGHRDLIFATNLDEKDWPNELLGPLYARRWGIETSFRDLVLKGFEFWHSKNLNGLLQELYAGLWLINFARLQLLEENTDDPDLWLEKEYKKANLKLMVTLLIDVMPLILKKKYKQVLAMIRSLIKRTTQNRRRQTRAFARVRKYSRKSFPFYNLVKRRDP